MPPFNPETHVREFIENEDKLKSVSKEIVGEKSSEEFLSLIAERDRLKKVLEKQIEDAHGAAIVDDKNLSESKQRILEIERKISELDTEKKGLENVSKEIEGEKMENLNFVESFYVNMGDQKIFVSSFVIENRDLYGDKLLDLLKNSKYENPFFSREEVNYILSNPEFDNNLKKGYSKIFLVNVKEDNGREVFVRATRDPESTEEQNHGVKGWGFYDYNTKLSGNFGDPGDIVFVRND